MDKCAGGGGIWLLIKKQLEVKKSQQNNFSTKCVKKNTDEGRILKISYCFTLKINCQK